MTFNNKVIWVTGASSGIGKGLVEHFSKMNCKLIISARNNDKLEAIKQASKTPENIAVIPFDLAEIDNMKTVVKTAINYFGNIDILINNGGISQRSLIVDTDISVDKKLMDVDYLGTVALSKALLPHFIKNKNGHFVVVTSLMGKFSSPYRSGYCGAKHALHGFFDALRMEHQKDNIKVTIVCPGFVNTNIAKNALIGDGSLQNKQDQATENGLTITQFCKRMVNAIQKEKFEVYIGKKEILGVYLKRFFPKLLHKFILKSDVR
ncbi:putative oxidoreductase/dehydrogenase [Mesoflavibacter sp. HG96]|uniref:SDR family oxidoreductase n=1 Tax=unclassified Mesoflavibacter TaxID=2630131 RepID=UPI000D105A3C|nr:MULTISPECIES: SDR family oxidoreductase [unclassified Mesoflavibacter]QIJ90408.1 putative oxidoreductase/dehydrogenase [Mesoflavibacter sp. HG96]QIJ93136.1 putative oxidoreductase/dehydrogenase [Mesoflavibacter sp. HG37]